MYGLQQKLKFMKDCLKKWNKESFGNITMEKRRFENQIGELQIRIMNEGYTEMEKIKEHNLMQDLIQSKK